MDGRLAETRETPQTVADLHQKDALQHHLQLQLPDTSMRLRSGCCSSATVAAKEESHSRMTTLAHLSAATRAGPLHLVQL
jgi:hypothetical protein